MLLMVRRVEDAAPYKPPLTGEVPPQGAEGFMQSAGGKPPAHLFAHTY